MHLKMLVIIKQAGMEVTASASFTAYLSLTMDSRVLITTLILEGKSKRDSNDLMYPA